MTNPPRKGINCPRHPTARLKVDRTVRVGIGIVVRYRTCTVPGCTVRIPTEERIRPHGGCRKVKNSTNP